MSNEERKWHYAERIRVVLAKRFGEETVPLLDSAAAFVADLNRVPLGTIQQCSRHQCMAAQARVFEDGQLQWVRVVVSEMARGSDSACGQGDHTWRILKASSGY